MDNAEWAIRKGLGTTKNVMNAELSSTAFKSGITTHKFEDAELVNNFNWKNTQAGLQVTLQMTTWSRY